MGAFDDLVPQQQAPAQGGAFDDLVPQQPQQPEQPWYSQFTDSIGRSTARAATPIVAGAALGAAMGAPIGGVGAIPGAIAGAGAMGLAELLDKLTGLGASDALMDKLGLPKPSTPAERVGADVVGAMGMQGGAQALGQTMQQLGPRAAQEIGKMLAERQLFQQGAAVAAGAGAGTAREEGAGPLGQLAAGIAAPVGAATVAGLARPIAGSISRMVDTAFSPSGGTRAAGRIAADVAGKRAPDIIDALRSGEIPETAAGAAAPAGSAEFAGLERMVGAHDPSTFGSQGSVERTRTAWETAQRNQLNAATNPTREAEMLAANAGQSGQPLSANPILLNIEQMLKVPEYAANPTARRVLGTWRNELLRAVDDPMTGEVNANALHAVRKGINSKIGQLDRTPGWDKAVAEKLSAEVRQGIDFAIEGSSGNLTPAGNPAWEDYLAQQSAGHRRIEGVGERADIAKAQGSAGAAQARRTFDADETPFTIPNFLSRPVMVANAAIRWLEGRGGAKAVNELARLMAPEQKVELARLMSAEIAKRNARMPAAEVYGRAAGTGAVIGAAR